MTGGPDEDRGADDGPASGQPITVRIDGGAVTASDDHGRTWTATGSHGLIAAALRRQDWRPASRPALTAGGAALLAEARSCLPVREPLPTTARPAAGLGQTGIRVQDRATSRPLQDVLRTRRTTRRLAGTLPLTSVGSVLCRSFATAGFDVTTPLPRAFAALPSAGGRRPVRALLLAADVDGLPARSLWAFDPTASRLRPVPAGPSAVERVLAAAAHAGGLAADPAAAVLLIADFGRTLLRYPGGAALVWRDAGVHLAGVCLAAEDIGLGACVLGTAGSIDEDVCADGFAAAGTLPIGPCHEVGMIALGPFAADPRR